MPGLTPPLACRNRKGMRVYPHIRSRRVEDLIDALGGQRQISDYLGVPIGTVGAWRHRRYISPAFWALIVEMAHSRGMKGFTLQKIYDMHYGDPAREVA